MILKLLTEYHLEFLSLKGGCRGSPESTLVKMVKVSAISCRGSYATRDDSGDLVHSHSHTQLLQNLL